MSAQINLYHPRYLKQRDPFALAPVLAATLSFYLLLGVLSGWAWREASDRQALAAAADAQLKLTKAQVAAATQAAATRKPSAQMLAEVETAEALLRRREGILRLLEGGAIGTTSGFAEHFRALARQAPQGLWLTGISIAGGGGDIRISGSTLHAAAVPDYIGRLGREKAFQGKSFAALTMLRPTASTSPTGPVAVPGTGGGSGTTALIAALAGIGAAPVPTSAATPGTTPPAQAASRQIDFVLLPKVASAGEAKP